MVPWWWWGSGIIAQAQDPTFLLTHITMPRLTKNIRTFYLLNHPWPRNQLWDWHWPWRLNRRLKTDLGKEIRNDHRPKNFISGSNNGKVKVVRKLWQKVVSLIRPVPAQTWSKSAASLLSAVRNFFLVARLPSSLGQNFKERETLPSVSTATKPGKIWWNKV